MDTVKVWITPSNATVASDVNAAPAARRWADRAARRVSSSGTGVTVAQFVNSCAAPYNPLQTPPAKHANAIESSRRSTSRPTRPKRPLLWVPVSYKSANSRLVEKFQILGRDDIAGPLEELLPYVFSNDANIEVLTLLLALSDRPVDSVAFDADKFVVRQEVKKEMSWEEILAEEPFEGDHWAEPDYQGSDEESDWVYEGTAVKVEKTGPVVKDDVKICEIRPDEGTTKEVEELLERQYWLRRKKFAIINEATLPELNHRGIASLDGNPDLDRLNEEYFLITELDAIREVLFMLSGFNCILFNKHKRNIEVSPRESLALTQVNKTEYRLDHVSSEAFKSVLTWCADYGTSIHLCRTYSRHTSKTPTIQTFSAALSTHLSQLALTLTNLQTTYANRTTDTTSLLSLQNTLSPLLELFHSLRTVLFSTTSNSLLTALHKTACQSHAIGNLRLHEFILSLFLPSLETYLRPLHGWMTDGTLDPTIHPEFFIISTQTEDRVVYEISVGGAPRFMEHTVNRVLAAGKTINFIKSLRSPITYLDSTPFSSSLRDQFDSDTSSINPFEQAFEAGFEAWITQKYDFASQMLCDTLRSSREIWDQLDWIHGLYCLLHVSCTNRFTAALFEKMNAPGDWRDRHILTDDLQEAFAESIPRGLLSVRIQRSCSLTQPLKCLDLLKFNLKVPSSVVHVLIGDLRAYLRNL